MRWAGKAGRKLDVLLPYCPDAWTGTLLLYHKLMSVHIRRSVGTGNGGGQGHNAPGFTGGGDVCWWRDTVPMK